jgi:hypothetical protein
VSSSSSFKFGGSEAIDYEPISTTLGSPSICDLKVTAN